MKSKPLMGLQVRFLLAFFISFLTGLFVFLLLNGITRENYNSAGSEIEKFESVTSTLLTRLVTYIDDDDALQGFINEVYSGEHQVEVYMVDLEGFVLLQPGDQHIARFDLSGLTNRTEQEYIDEHLTIYKLVDLGDKTHAIMSKTITKPDGFQWMLVGVLVFILLFFFLTYPRLKYLAQTTAALRTIASGNLDQQVPLKGSDEIRILAENINHMTRELNTRIELERKSDQAKNELITNISHDLRTPLTSIIGYTKLIEETGQLSGESTKYLEIIDQKSAYLQKLIHDLFEYTRLTGIHVELSRSEISLNELLRQIIEDLLPLLSENNQKIEFSASVLETTVLVDGQMIARVFENILVNAIKYSTPASTILVGVTGGSRFVQVRITNQGKTLSPSELEHLFDRFFRTDEARNSTAGGAGLGLAIAKSIVELHRGHIRVENTTDGVSTVVELNTVSQV